MKNNSRNNKGTYYCIVAIKTGENFFHQLMFCDTTLNLPRQTLVTAINNSDYTTYRCSYVDPFNNVVDSSNILAQFAQTVLATFR